MTKPTDQVATAPKAGDRANRVRQVADRFNTSERHIWRLIESGELRAQKLGARCTRIFDSEVERYLTRFSPP